MMIPRSRRPVARRPYGVAAVAALLSLVAWSGCSRDGAGVTRRFQLAGVVVGRDASPPRVVIAHDHIDGFMPAMTMPFETSSDAPPLREGDRITATLVVTATRSHLEDVRITGRGAATGVRAPSNGRAMPGALVPDLQLVDQHAQPLTLRGFAGRVVVITFIYTRCPLPDFCPLMVTHLEHVRRRANEEGIGDRLALLGVTLDPAFDAPAVLRSYGESVLKGSDRFDRWTLATGTARQIEDVAGFFGVGYKADAGFVTHTLTTTVVSHEGRVMRTFTSNSWRPDDLFDVVRTGVQRVPGD